MQLSFSLEAEDAEQQTTNTKLKEEIRVLQAALEKQAPQIEKVTAQLSAIQAAPRLVTNE